MITFTQHIDKPYQDHTAVRSVEMTANDNGDLNDVLSAFEQFLSAAGFYFDGDLQIVNNDYEIEDENPTCWADNAEEDLDELQALLRVKEILDAESDDADNTFWSDLAMFIVKREEERSE